MLIVCLMFLTNKWVMLSLLQLLLVCLPPMHFFSCICKDREK